MQILSLTATPGRPVTQFDSVGLVHSPLARAFSEAVVGTLTLDAGGQVGFHKAAVPQLFVVLHGAGWVTGPSQTHVPIAAGQAAFWNKDEWHSAGTAEGLMALVLESESLELFPSLLNKDNSIL